LVFRQEKSLADWSSDPDFGSWLEIANVVGADALDFFTILVVIN